MDNPMVDYSKIIADTASQHYNVRDEYKDNTIEENVAIQKAQSRKFSVGVINITGELNIGMMIRSACLFGAENFYIFGRKKFDKRSTVGAENYINIVQVIYDEPMAAEETMCEDIWALRQKQKYQVILCEQGGMDIGQNRLWKKLHDYIPHTHPLFLFGSESHGIPPIISDIAFATVSIPQVGVLRSFNVSAAMNIICWDYIQQVYL